MEAARASRSTPTCMPTRRRRGPARRLVVLLAAWSSWSAGVGVALSTAASDRCPTPRAARPRVGGARRRPDHRAGRERLDDRRRRAYAAGCRRGRRRSRWPRRTRRASCATSTTATGTRSGCSSSGRRRAGAPRRRSRTRTTRSTRSTTRWRRSTATRRCGSPRRPRRCSAPASPRPTRDHEADARALASALTGYSPAAVQLRGRATRPPRRLRSGLASPAGAPGPRRTPSARSRCAAHDQGTVDVRVGGHQVHGLGGRAVPGRPGRPARGHRGRLRRPGVVGRRRLGAGLAPRLERRLRQSPGPAGELDGLGKLVRGGAGGSSAPRAEDSPELGPGAKL